MGKVEEAKLVVSKAMKAGRNPAVYCSFGKDSMAMLWLIRSMGLDLPVVFHREPWMPHKYRFANQIIEEHGLRVYDWAPLNTGVIRGDDGKMEVVNVYECGMGKTLTLPTGMCDRVEGRPFLCAKDDLYGKPLGAFAPPWDMLFVGQRGDDRCPIQGDIPAKVDVYAPPGAPAFVFPFRTWTEGDVWQYTEEMNVPVQMSRYEKVDGVWRERADRNFNSDYFESCWACMDPQSDMQVDCPKLGMRVCNVSRHLRWVERFKHDYVRE